MLYLPGHLAPQTRDVFGDNTRDDYARLLLAPDRQAFYAAVSARRDARRRMTGRFLPHDAAAQPLVRRAVLRLFGMHVDARSIRAWATGGLTALLVLLGDLVVLIVLFILGPLAVTSRGTLGAAAGRASLAYFACLGAARSC